MPTIRTSPEIRERRRASARFRPTAFRLRPAHRTAVSIRSTARARRPKLYPGAPKPKALGPGTPQPSAPKAKVAAPVSPSVAGTFPGQPLRRRLKPDDDPFANVGFHTGTFLTKGRGRSLGRLQHQSRPYRHAEELGVLHRGAGTADRIRLGAPFADRRSARLVHRLQHDVSAAGQRTVAGCRPTSTRRRSTARSRAASTPRATSAINTELRNACVHRQSRLANIQVLASRSIRWRPRSAAPPASEHDFNRLQVAVAGLADRTTYQYSKLTDGTSTTNDDRNFNQFGALHPRELRPDARPQAFGEFQIDTRVHDVNIDRSGFQRDSNGGYVKAGSTFEFSRLLTGRGRGRLRAAEPYQDSPT